MVKKDTWFKKMELAQSFESHMTSKDIGPMFNNISLVYILLIMKRKHKIDADLVLPVAAVN